MSDQPATPKARNFWLPALIISLVVNGFMAGLLVSKFSKTDKRRSAQPAQIGMQLSTEPRRILRALPKDRRREVSRQAMQSLRDQGGAKPRELFRELREARKELLRVISEEPMDADALSGALDNIRTLNTKIANHGDTVLETILKQLTPEERALIVSEMQNRPKRSRRQRGGPDRR